MFNKIKEFLFIVEEGEKKV